MGIEKYFAALCAIQAAALKDTSGSRFLPFMAAAVVAMFATAIIALGKPPALKEA